MYAGFVNWILNILGKGVEHRFSKEIEKIKHNYEQDIKDFEFKSERALRKVDQFSSISQETYHDFFKSRVTAYKEFLEFKKSSRDDLDKPFYADEYEQWGELYYADFISLKELISNHEFYISNELSSCFNKLLNEAAPHLDNERRTFNHAMMAGADGPQADEEASEEREKLMNGTHHLLKNVWDQIEIDVSKIRSRVDLDS